LTGYDGFSKEKKGLAKRKRISDERGMRSMAGKNNDTFERIEKKYLLDAQTYQILLPRLQKYMAIDEYGLSTICNVYYDTPQYDLIRRSLEKPVYKEKLRIRSYGVPREDSPVFVEIKKKWQGVVYKRRVELSMQEGRDYLNNSVKPEKNTQIRREIDYFLDFYKPVPKMYIAYDRIAMYGKQDESLRLTLDFNIRARDYDLDLTKGDDGRLLMDKGMVLMEIKVGGAYPIWLSSLLNEMKIYQISFSKYGTAYQQMMRDQMAGWVSPVCAGQTEQEKTSGRDWRSILVAM